MAFDTLAYIKQLEAAGVEREVAEAHVKALAEHALPELATKSDLELARRDLEARIELLQRDLTIRLGSMIAIATGILIAIRFLGHG
jgi:hypothetical protein